MELEQQLIERIKSAPKEIKKKVISMCRVKQKVLLKKSSVFRGGQYLLSPEQYDALRHYAEVAVLAGDKDQRAHLFTADECRTPKFSFDDFWIRVEDNPQPSPHPDMSYLRYL